MKTKRIKIRGKVIEVEVCDAVWSRARGLMFKKQSKPLLFVFKKAKRRNIHSFFCKPFKAVWMRGEKIIDKRLIDSWKFSIKPKEKFDKLLEIPLRTKT